MAYYCNDCGKVMIPEKFIDHQDCCRCNEFLAFESSGSSCIEKSLFPKAVLTWRYNQKCPEWRAETDSFIFIIDTHSNLWIYNKKGGYTYLADDCSDPRLFMWYIRRYV